MSSGHLPIGPGLLFDLAHPNDPLHDHRLLCRQIILQLPPSLLVLHPTSQPSIQDDHLDVLPLPHLLSLRRLSRRIRRHLRHGLSDRRIRTLAVLFLVRSSQGRSDLSYLQRGQVAIRFCRKDPYGSDLVDGSDGRLCLGRSFRFHKGMLGCRRTLLHRNQETDRRSLRPEAKI